MHMVWNHLWLYCNQHSSANDIDQLMVIKKRAWVLIELHLNPLYFFTGFCKISSSLWFYNCCFFFLYEKLYYPLGWKPDPSSAHMRTWVSIFFEKNHWDWFSWEPNSYSWENLVFNPFLTKSIHHNLRTRLKIEMKTESPVRTSQLWTKPQSEEEYTADQFT